MVEDQLAAGVGQGHRMLLQPAIEQGQVAAIGNAGVVGQAFFQPQGVEELVDQRVVQGRHENSVENDEMALSLS
ncbi:hypothetical protein D3C81_2250740 [compost metagenome]